MQLLITPLQVFKSLAMKAIVVKIKSMQWNWPVLRVTIEKSLVADLEKSADGRKSQKEE